MAFETHLKRLAERHENASLFLNQIFPLDGAELAFVDLNVSSGTPTWDGKGNLKFLIGIKDGANILDVMAEFSAKARTTKLRGDLMSCKINRNSVRSEESHTNLLRNGVFAAEIECIFYVHYNMADCIAGSRE